MRGGPWFTSLDLKDVFPPRSYSQGSQEISQCHLHERGVCLTATAIHLLLMVCGGCAGATQASWDKNIILYLDDLLVLSHSEESARRDTMTVINDCSIFLQNPHCRLWFSLSHQDLPRWGLDTMARPPKPRALMFAFPPLQLIHPLLEQVKQEDPSLILVAPESRLALWFP